MIDLPNVQLIRAETPLQGSLRWTLGDHGFSFVPADANDLERRQGRWESGSLEVGTLQIEVGVETNQALYVWGYHPETLWSRQRLTAPEFLPGGLRFLSIDIEPAAALLVARVAEWSTLFDPDHGLIWVTADDSPDDIVVEVAQDSAIGILDGKLHSVWLRPMIR